MSPSSRRERRSWGCHNNPETADSNVSKTCIHIYTFKAPIQLFEFPYLFLDFPFSLWCTFNPILCPNGVQLIQGRKSFQTGKMQRVPVVHKKKKMEERGHCRNFPKYATLYIQHTVACPTNRLPAVIQSFKRNHKAVFFSPYGCSSLINIYQYKLKSVIIMMHVCENKW